jgi:hypothetical protein
MAGRRSKRLHIESFFRAIKANLGGFFSPFILFDQPELLTI